MNTVLCSLANLYVGLVTLSPMSVAPVCRVGDPLQITCTVTASVRFISWGVFQINEQGTLEQIVSDVLISSTGSNNQMTSITVNSVMFTFMRSSSQGASPLISTLSIDSVSIGLNGTIVNCSDLTDSVRSASTTIQIIDTSQSEFVSG